jgi:hypothetical protein
MVPSLKLSFVSNGNDPTGVGLAPGSTIHFGSLEFTTNRLGTTLEESSDEYGTTSCAWGSSGSPGPRGFNVETSTDPITATPVSENTPALQTIPMVTVRTVVAQAGMKFLPDHQQA